MIINFSVQNFGSIKERQTLSFEADKSTHLEEHYIINAPGGLRLLKLALIYGANGSGKSTVLKALDFLLEMVMEPLGKKTDEFDFQPFLFDPHTPNENSILAIEFIQNSVKYSYEIVFSKQAIIHEQLNFYNPNKANIYKRTTDLAKQLTAITFGSKIKVDKAFEKSLEANTLWNRPVLGGFLKTNIEIKELSEVIHWFFFFAKHTVGSTTPLQNFAESLIINKRVDKRDVLNVLKRADLNVSDIIFQKEELQQSNTITTITKTTIEHTVDNQLYKLPLELESDGTQRYYGFAALLCLLIKEPCVLPIDELEASLHPELYIHFLLSFLMNAKQSQLIATTHNREILDNKDLFRNDAIWFTDKSETGATELYSLADFDTSAIRDTTNVLNAYKSGRLKGTPNLGDYYIDLSK